AMLLQRGKVLGYDFNRMVVDFTMFNQGKTVRCAISTAAMDDLEGKHEVKADQRVDQFLRLRDAIEERASRKFFERPVHAEGPVVLRPTISSSSTANSKISYRSLRSDAKLFDDLAPLVRIRTGQCREFFGTRFGRFDRDVLHPLFYLGQEQNMANLGIKSRDNLL